MAIYKSAPRTRQITTPAPDYSVFYRPDALPAAQPTVSKHLSSVFTYPKIMRDIAVQNGQGFFWHTHDFTPRKTTGTTVLIKCKNNKAIE